MSRNTFVLASVLILITSGASQAQVTINGPEGVVFDTLYNRYLIANWNGRNIIQIDEHGDSSYFVIGTPWVGGLRIVDSLLYGAGQTQIVAYHLATGSLVVSVPFAGANLLNALATDTSGYLYVSDGSPNRIYRMKLSDNSWSVFVDNDPALPFPIGLYFEPETNRLLVTARPDTRGVICAVSLPDGAVSNVLTTSAYPPFAYITRDNTGRYLMSCFSAGRIVRYDHAFTGPGEVLLTHYNTPTQLYYNRLVDTLVVPDYTASTIDFVSFRDIDLDGVEEFRDNCLEVANVDQRDSDLDGMGDSCDVCTDTDHDGLGNPGFPANTCEVDYCPGHHSETNVDTDADGVGDPCDPCPEDPNKDWPGECGCGVPDVDSDGDAVLDCFDLCPGFDDSVDMDGDGVPDGCDNCPDEANPSQEDTDGDNIGDVCDGCCLGRVGDVNGQGEYPDEVTLGDIMLLVDVKFVSGDCSVLPCLTEADVNQDGGLAPTCDDHVTLGDIMTLVDFLFITGPGIAVLPDCL
jgi:hypothetical protein